MYSLDEWVFCWVVHFYFYTLRSSFKDFSIVLASITRRLVKFAYIGSKSRALTCGFNRMQNLHIFDHVILLNPFFLIFLL
jgi:hypothetical protein